MSNPPHSSAGCPGTDLPCSSLLSLAHFPMSSLVELHRSSANSTLPRLAHSRPLSKVRSTLLNSLFPNSCSWRCTCQWRERGNGLPFRHRPVSTSRVTMSPSWRSLSRTRSCRMTAEERMMPGGQGDHCLATAVEPAGCTPVEAGTAPIGGERRRNCQIV
jgi:hypothetical protein